MKPLFNTLSGRSELRFCPRRIWRATIVTALIPLRRKGFVARFAHSTLDAVDPDFYRRPCARRILLLAFGVIKPVFDAKVFVIGLLILWQIAARNFFVICVDQEIPLGGRFAASAFDMDRRGK